MAYKNSFYSGNKWLTAELLKQYKQVEQLNQEDKHLVKPFIDAFLTKRQLQQLAQ